MDINVKALKKCVDSVRDVQKKIDELNKQKAETFKKAKLADLDVTAIKTVLRRLYSKNADQLREQDALADKYIDALDGTKSATRVQAREAAAAA
jgi:uncharacterized protein (UPF0335 family)